METFKLINPVTGGIVRMTVTGQAQVWKTARYSYREGRAIVRDAPLLLRRYAEKTLGESLKWVEVN
jgi:hypothetical protein